MKVLFENYSIEGLPLTSTSIQTSRSKIYSQLRICATFAQKTCFLELYVLKMTLKLNSFNSVLRQGSALLYLIHARVEAAIYKLRLLGIADAASIGQKQLVKSIDKAFIHQKPLGQMYNWSQVQLD